ncbi:hypothetical protein LCGC14_1589450 [marine sediment metagenome]|uniref:DUF5131 family protein n=1 Tax=marine sediment metagenome TaxID=412755 RepID=A0A0F9KV37_9ZZZZ
MNRTKIESVRNPDGTPGYTWNPITGCLYHIDGMCKGGGFPCWAWKLAKGRLFERYTANNNYAPVFSDGKGIATDLCDTFDPFYLRFWPEKLKEFSEHAYKPKGIFACDMSDLFGIGVPEEWTRQVLAVIKHQFIHRFYLLTKQPQNLAKFSPFPDNCYVGVTATNPDMFDAAFRALMEIQAKVKYICFEPLLHWARVENLQRPLQELDWVIIGAQTKPLIVPDLSWVQTIALAATKANIPLFLKNSLKPHLPNRMPFWGTYIWKELSAGVPVTMSENRFRQELPDWDKEDV